MKTIITSNSRALTSVLCTLLLGIASLWALPRNAEAENIVYVSENQDIVGEYKANGVAIHANFINAQQVNGLLVSGDILYAPTFNTNTDQYVIATYNAETGAVINFNFYGYPAGVEYAPAGLVLSGNNLYVANYEQDSIALINITDPSAGNPNFIQESAVNPLAYPYALAIKGNVLYVTNNYENSNGNVYISEYNATTGEVINANFIQIPLSGLYGLAVKVNHLFVSVFGGNSGAIPGIAEYDATTGALINASFASVNEPEGIAIVGNTLYVASYHDEVIYEFDATTGAKLSNSITLTTQIGPIAVRAVKK